MHVKSLVAMNSLSYVLATGLSTSYHEVCACFGCSDLFQVYLVTGLSTLVILNSQGV